MPERDADPRARLTGAAHSQGSAGPQDGEHQRLLGELGASKAAVNRLVPNSSPSACARLAPNQVLSSPVLITLVGVRVTLRLTLSKTQLNGIDQSLVTCDI